MGVVKGSFVMQHILWKCEKLKPHAQRKFRNFGTKKNSTTQKHEVDEGFVEYTTNEGAR